MTQETGAAQLQEQKLSQQPQEQQQEVGQEEEDDEYERALSPAFPLGQGLTKSLGHLTQTPKNRRGGGSSSGGGNRRRSESADADECVNNQQYEHLAELQRMWHQPNASTFQVGTSVYRLA